MNSGVWLSPSLQPPPKRKTNEEGSHVHKGNAQRNLVDSSRRSPMEGPTRTISFVSNVSSLVSRVGETAPSEEGVTNPCGRPKNARENRPFGGIHRRLFILYLGWVASPSFLLRLISLVVSVVSKRRTFLWIVSVFPKSDFALAQT